MIAEILFHSVTYFTGTVTKGKDRGYGLKHLLQE